MSKPRRPQAAPPASAAAGRHDGAPPARGGGADATAEALHVAEAELRAQNEALIDARDLLDAERLRYQDLFDFAPEAYLVTDGHGKVLEANHAASELLNEPASYLPGRPLASYVAPAHRREFRWALARLAAGGHGRGEWTWAVRPRKCPPVDADATAVTDRDALGRVKAIRWLLRDVRARRRAEQEIAAYQQRLQSLAAELALAEERERRRLAVELHDTVSQQLAMAKVRLGQARQKAVLAPVAEAIEAARNLVDEALKQTRSLTFELSPPVLYELGFVAAVEWLAERVQKRGGPVVLVTCAADCRDTRLPEPLAILLFQAVRELLNNVVKHAAARNVDVIIAPEGRNYTVVVRDDGRGFDPSDARSSSGDDTGFGLFSLRTRLGHLGGQFHVESAPGQGTRVALSVPLWPVAAGDDRPAGSSDPALAMSTSQAAN